MMIKHMQRIYRRWLSRYRLANMLKAWFLHTYLRYWTLSSSANIPYEMLESAAQLATHNEHDSAEIWQINNVIVLGNSRLILKDQQAVYDASYPDRLIKNVYADYLFQEEIHLLAIFEPRSGRYILPYLKAQTRLNGVWLSVMSASADNWMHWLSESIPRLAIAMVAAKDLNFGLLLDQQLPKNMRDVLDIFAANTDRFEVPTHHSIEVSQLLVPSGHAGMSAFWPRNPSNAGNGIFYFDQLGLKLARDMILKHFECQPRKVKKLFILRKSFFRQIANQDRVKLLLSSHGFESISPGEMTVEEQVRVFSVAAVVVAQSGAALANIMFMPKDSMVICLSARNEHVNYDYFRDYAKIFGVALEYVLGEIDEPAKYDVAHMGRKMHPMNAGFVCPENELIAELEKVR
jgi:capsular polysaccharide biosynthesis protein